MFLAFMPLFTLLTAIFSVRADPDPSSPAPGDVFIQGEPCLISWEADLTGLWKNMDIELMTGDNFDMISLTPIATVDGTNPSENTYSYTCPNVTPHSPIYFYQFSSSSTSNKTWTGRFTITDSSHDIVPPSQSTQKDGEKIPWGVGALVGPSNASSSALVANASASASATSPSNVSTSFLSITSSLVSTTPSTVPTSAANRAPATSPTLNMFHRTGLALGLGLVAFSFAVIY